MINHSSFNFVVKLVDTQAEEEEGERKKVGCFHLFTPREREREITITNVLSLVCALGAIA